MYNLQNPGFSGMGGMMQDLTGQLPFIPKNVQSGGQGLTQPTTGTTSATRTDAEQFAGLESGAEQRATDSLLSSAKGNIAKNAGSSVVGGLMGGDVNLLDMVNPVGMLTSPAKAIYSGVGVETPDSFGGWLASKIPTALAATMGLNPVVGLAAGLMGAPLADAFGDITGWRDGDEARDKLEDASGEVRGRTQYKDAMDQYDVTDTSISDEAKNFYDAAQQAKTRGQTATNVDAIKAAIDQYNAFQALANVQDYGDVMNTIGSGYGNTVRGTNESIDRDLSSFFGNVNSGNYSGSGGYSEGSQGMAGGGSADDDGGAGWGF